MKHMIRSTLNTALNSLLQLDPTSKQRLRDLQDKVIFIEILPFHYILQILIHEEALHLQEEAILAPDVTIRGTPLQMSALAFDRHDVTIEGNAETAYEVLHLFSHLHIDWEELMSHVMGDTTAYHANKLVKHAGHWLRHIEQSLSENIDEYVHEEKQWFPTREALQDLFNEIDNLRMEVDRIEARISLLIRSQQSAL